MQPYFVINHFDGNSIDKGQFENGLNAMVEWIPDQRALLYLPSQAYGQLQRFNTPHSKFEILPYQTPCKNFIIVADARLDNREELRDQLILREVDDLAVSDSQLILECYFRWGEDAAQHLRGDFAFVVYDKRKNIFYCARDHIGNRNLYYRFTPKETFICATVISAFRSIRSLTLKLNASIIMEQLIAHFENAADTIYQTIFKLPPAHFMVVTPTTCKIKRYWSAAPKKTIVYQDKKQYIEHADDLFRKVTKQMLRSEYPIATHLSGGLDSSTVAYTAAALLAEQNQGIHAFGAIIANENHEKLPPTFNFANVNDAHLMRSVAARQPNISLKIIEDPCRLFCSETHDFPYLDNPYYNPNNISWILAIQQQAASLNCRTMLTGAMGNSTLSFAGFDATLRKQLGRLKTQSKIELQRMYKRITRDHRDFWENVYLQNDYVAANRFAEMHTKHKDKHKFAHLLRCALNHLPQAANSGHFYLQHCQSGVEHRDPTADVRLVDLILSFPNDVFFDSSATPKKRRLVREMMKERLPESVLNNTTLGLQAAAGFLALDENKAECLQHIERLNRNGDLRHYFDFGKMKLHLETFDVSQSYASRSNFNAHQIRFMRGLFQSLQCALFMEWLLTTCS